MQPKTSSLTTLPAHDGVIVAANAVTKKAKNYVSVALAVVDEATRNKYLACHDQIVEALEAMYKRLGGRKVFSKKGRDCFIGAYAKLGIEQAEAQEKAAAKLAEKAHTGNGVTRTGEARVIEAMFAELGRIDARSLRNGALFDRVADYIAKTDDVDFGGFGFALAEVEQMKNTFDRVADIIGRHGENPLYSNAIAALDFQINLIEESAKGLVSSDDVNKMRRTNNVASVGLPVQPSQGDGEQHAQQQAAASQQQ